MHDWKPRMKKATRHLAEQLRGIRTGGVSLGMIQTIRVECQGRSVPINHLAVLKSQGDRFLVTPFDRAVVPSVVKAFNAARLSAYALSPETVSVSVPPISVEQRGEILRYVKKLGEEAKVAVRSIRQQARKQIESSGRGSLRAVQEATDAAIEEIEQLVKAKATELT
jgi:ribosome recycling factor